ncbi:ABC transporter, substrate-binding protein [Paraburkholderia piptadeniae]|uniref:ABC transporter, substrate-binding protein n=1 Tax=Paraburkholderia piptadeniae TaxID=1701573 RepID=A0A1N7SK77_9BURK|nr:ABC transporter substrate-binding protein [Paraburkholderia piptadeniae]SIT47807.1 ABC transporter, substrate-binding protein [Paraburkholderia piptadeniae]
MKHSVLRLMMGALALSTVSHSAFAANDKITLMVGGMEKQIYLPAMLAQRLGYFKEQGLDVELLNEPAGVDAENELIAGSVQGVVGFYDHTIDIQAKGKYLESVVQFSHTPGEVELVATKMADKIKSPADFKGKTLGVTGLGSSTNFLTQYLGVSHGVKLSEMTSLPVGAGNTFIAAMQQGKIDAGMTTEPTISRLVDTGQAKVLIDLRSPENTQKVLGGLYPAASLYMQTQWVQEHKDLTQKLANAFVKTLQYIHTHSAEEITQKMPADYYAGDRAAYVKALAEGKKSFIPDGRMPESGPATVLKVLSAFDQTVKGHSIDLSKTYTTEFVSAAKTQ